MGTLNTKYICNECGQNFPARRPLKHHMKRHFPFLLQRNEIIEREFECDLCSRKFLNQNTLDIHKIKYHNPDNVVLSIRRRARACNVCGKLFTRSDRLREHALIHSKVRPYICDICGKSFKQLCVLRTHKQTHTGTKFFCEFCKKEFKSREILRLHRKLHTGKPHKCDECDRSYCKQYDLQKHKRKCHENSIINTQCQFCLTQFNNASALAKHKFAIHYEELKFRCQFDDCTRRFDSDDRLRIHLKSHDESRKPSCPVCGKVFTKLANMKKHVTKFHREFVEEAN